MGRILTRKNIDYTDQPNKLATAQEVIAKGLICSDSGNKLTDNIQSEVRWYASDEGTLDVLGTTSYMSQFTLIIESVYEQNDTSEPVSDGDQIPVLQSSTVQASGAQYHVIQKKGENGIPATLSDPRVETVNVGLLPPSNSGSYIMRFKAQCVLTGDAFYNIYQTNYFKTFSSKVEVYNFLRDNIIKVSTYKSGNVLYVKVSV